MLNNSFIKLEKSSFRDPSSTVFYYEGEPYRIINESYKNEYNHLINSGLLNRLIQEKLIIATAPVTQELREKLSSFEEAIIIKPVKIPFISYSYEWSFSQLKDAALLTLRIARLALEYGMILKDASSYNVQFYEGKPIFIDTCSFDIYKEGGIWSPYKQFIQHFYAPLALASFVDIRLLNLLKTYIDGIPLNLCSKLLPFKARFNFNVFLHVYLHSITVSGSRKDSVTQPQLSLKKLRNILESIEDGINSLRWKSVKSQWGDYYNITNYSDDSFLQKKETIHSLISELNINYAWDIGANSGVFSELVSKQNILTISFDIDYVAIEKNYLKYAHKKNILPLVMDFCNPSPDLGWDNQERTSIIHRGTPDLILALAIIHHLVITNNLSFNQVAEYFSKYCKYLIIEFVPKEDSQSQIILGSKTDIFKFYKEENFLEAFSKYFDKVSCQSLDGTMRTIYLFKNKYAK